MVTWTQKVYKKELRGEISSYIVLTFKDNSTIEGFLVCGNIYSNNSTFKNATIIGPKGIYVFDEHTGFVHKFMDGIDARCALQNNEELPF